MCERSGVRDSFLSVCVCAKKYNSSLCCSLSLALPPPLLLASRLCSLSPSPHHLSVSHHCEGGKPWGASQPDLLNGASSYMRCVFLLRACAYVGDSESFKVERRGQIRLDIFNNVAYLTWGPWVRSWVHWMRSMAYILPTCANTYTHTYPWSVPLLVSQVVLRFDLDTVGQPKPPSLSFFSLSLSLSLSLALSPSLQPSGWLARQPWGV